MLDAKAVTIAINGKPIVHGVDLAVPPGAVTVVIGPNGSGKTTLFRALSGEMAYGGRITLDGEDLSTLRPRHIALRRAVLPQSSLLPFPFTVREVVAMGTRGGDPGVGLAELETLPERALERVDLSGFAGRFYADLSGGEQQRVQMARVLCQVWMPVLDGRPRYLLLDEPVSSLDIKHQIAIMDIARDFARAGGGALAILHDLNLAARYADTIHAMKAGRRIASGPPQEIISAKTIAAIFDIPLFVEVAKSKTPFVLPHRADHPAQG